MTFREKVLYHQIHPIKLIVDVGVTAPACYLFWKHEISAGLAVALVAPILVSAGILLAGVDLERYKRSSLGRYVSTYMTRTVEAVRLAGFALMAAGAWFHEAWLLPTGLAVVTLGWLRGVIWRDASHERDRRRGAGVTRS